MRHNGEWVGHFLFAVQKPVCFRAGLVNWRRARHLWRLWSVGVARGCSKKLIKNKYNLNIKN